jgi:hypothetical protein
MAFTKTGALAALDATAATDEESAPCFYLVL